MADKCHVNVVLFYSIIQYFCLKIYSIMTLGEFIKVKRSQKGMTQEELSAKTEISIRTIQRIENGEVDPRAYTLQMIAKALDEDFSKFVENASDENKETKKINDNNWLALVHLSGIFHLLFPTLLIWNRKKGKVKGIADHYSDVINFQLNFWIIFITPGLWVFWTSGEIIPIIVLYIFSALYSILTTINVINGKPYKYIFLIKFKNNQRKD